jgi:tripartite-type tricarboxylate transporter receptor subunit TctC
MRSLFVLALASIVLPAGSNAWGQAYPTRPIRLVIPIPPGGSPDVLARTLARQIEIQLGQNIIVDNRAGANGRPRAVNRVPACGMRTSASRDARRWIYRGHSIRLRGRIP